MRKVEILDIERRDIELVERAKIKKEWNFTEGG